MLVIPGSNPPLLQLARIVVWQPQIQLCGLTDHCSIHVTDHSMTGPLNIEKLVDYVSLESQNLRLGNEPFPSRTVTKY